MSTTHAEAAAPVPVIRVSAQIQRCGGVTCPPGTCDHDEEVQRLADGLGPAAVPASVHGVLGKSGAPLDTATRTSMEGRFGHGFGRVRIHTDADAARSAADIHALAYTFGPHVVMGAGRYQPRTSAGQLLLAHELAHVIQQGKPAGPHLGQRLARPGGVGRERAAVGSSAGAKVILRQATTSGGRTGRAAGASAAGAESSSRRAVVEDGQRQSPGQMQTQHFTFGSPHGADEREADAPADQVLAGGTARVAAAPLAGVQRQISDETAPDGSTFGADGPFGGGGSGGGGAGGTWDDAREAGFVSTSSGGGARSAPPSSGPVQVCARNLALTSLANHAYVEAPPKSYAVISPLCPQHWYDTPLNATSAQKWDNSPDPCGKTPSCVSCDPAPGVTDVRACLHAAFAAYANPSLYNAPFGPNSNTFAGTLARTCCANMVPKPAALGRVPGWDEPPASARGGSKPCPPGPTC